MADPVNSKTTAGGSNPRVAGRVPGPLAQLAERRADNAEVRGSSPRRPTRVLISNRPVFRRIVIAQPFQARYHAPMWITVPPVNRRGEGT